MFIRMFRTSVLTLLFCGKAYGQPVLRYVLDSHSYAPVPYATIKILNKKSGEIAAENGQFFLEIGFSDSILITSVGYHSKTLLGSQMSNKIFLNQKDDVLSSINVKTIVNTGSIVLGNGADSLNFAMRCPNEEFGQTCWPWGTANLKEEFAEKVTLPDSQATYKIKTVFVPVLKYGCWGSLLLRVYKADSNSVPGEEIFIKKIDVDKKMVKHNKVSVDVLNDNIYLQNEKEFFISVGWPPKMGNDNCLTTILLIKSGRANTYSRNLAADSYSWNPQWKLQNQKGEPILRNTAYAVELEVLK